MGFLSCSGTLLFQCACRSQQMPGRLASKFYRARLVAPQPHHAVFGGAQAMFALVGVGFACRQEPFRQPTGEIGPSIRTERRAASVLGRKVPGGSFPGLVRKNCCSMGCLGVFFGF